MITSYKLKYYRKNSKFFCSFQWYKTPNDWMNRILLTETLSEFWIQYDVYSVHIAQTAVSALFSLPISVTLIDPRAHTHHFLSSSFCTRVSVCGWVCVSVMKWPCVIFFRILFLYFDNVDVCGFYIFYFFVSSTLFSVSSLPIHLHDFFVVVIGCTALHLLFLQTDGPTKKFFK